ncbi:hypothetical protein [Streptomyces nigrescens]|uniref:hypothetical protein n=1 Tax=Streptomyces nigrescens TaxID=1920 RepID=UPI00367BC002
MTDDLRQRIDAAMVQLFGEPCSQTFKSGLTDAAFAALKPELDELLHYRNAITWETSCLSCSRILDNARTREEELERNIDYLKRNIRRSREQVDGYDQELTSAQRAIARVRALHQLNEDAGYCDLCSNHGDIAWPCATLRALDGADGEPRPADPALCAECGHPKGQHQDADEPVSVGLCAACDGEGSDDAHHSYEPEEQQ